MDHVSFLTATIKALIVVLSLTAPIASVANQPVVIAVFDSGPRHQHQKHVIAAIKQELNECTICKIKTFAIYDQNGNLFLEKFKSVLLTARSTADIFHFSWNLPYSEKTAPLVDELQSLVKTKKPVVAAAGRHNSRPGRLEQTVMGKVKDVIIVGELDSKGRLEMNSFYGPAIFTALLPPQGQKGSSFSAARFTGALASAMASGFKFSMGELSARKQRSGKRFPLLSDLFQSTTTDKKQPD